MSNNNGPKNFKQMKFPPSRYGSPSVSSPIISKAVKQVDPFKNYLNSLKCPICGSQIEGIKEPFYCVSDSEHYRMYLNDGLPYSASYELVVVCDDKSRRYAIVQNDTTKIVVSDSSIKETITFSFKVFDFSNTNKEKILNRLKTILVFQ
jgi:hypothetical protein